MPEKDRFYGKYAEYSDEDLIALLRDGDTQIMEYLLEKYKPLVRGKAAKMHLLGGECDDLIQEGMIGLYKAVETYDFGRDASFFTFADLCVTRKIFNAIKASTSQKNIPLNSYVSTSGQGENGDAAVSDMRELLEGQLVGDDNNPEKQALNREVSLILDKAMQSELSDFEREAFGLHMTGASSGEVAKILGKSPKSTDNAIQRARHKLQEHLQKNNIFG